MARSDHEGDRNHKEVRMLLRGLGPLVTAAGFIMTVVGLVSFFRAFGTGELPRYFLFAMIGLPVLGLGLMISKIGYLAAVSRYMAQELTPVSKDMFNDLAEGTRPGVESLARAVGTGFSQAAGGRPGTRCSACGTMNDAGSRYCSQCGTGLGESTCPACGKGVPDTAQFCPQCGTKLIQDRG